jgi:hypothetical protein
VTVGYGFGLALAMCLLVAVAMARRRRRAGAPRSRLGRWRSVRRQRRLIRHLDRSLRPTVDLLSDADLRAGLELVDRDRTGRPAIEKIAADLRRLAAQRLGVAARSPVWHSAVLHAYDDRLRLASRCLGVAEHLSDLDGVDLAIERLRVEGELQAAGLVLPAPIRRRDD